MVRRALSQGMRWPGAGALRRAYQRRWFCIGAWPSGKATGFGPVILGSNPSAPATISH
jgi:hypothetical protein